MSYILEALKKAEQARGFGQVPGIESLHDQPPPRPPRRWPWVLVAVLVLNAFVITGLWWYGESGKSDDTSLTARQAEPVADLAPGSVVTPPPVASRSDPAPRAGSATMPVQTDKVGAPALEPTLPPPMVARRPLRPLPLPARAPVPTPATIPTTTPAEPRQAREPLAPAAAPTPAPPAALTVPTEIVQLRAPSPPSPPEAEPSWKRLPLWPLVPENIRRQVKERLVLNVHVYSEQPEERFVLFNMKKYREGEQISQGLDLEEITREGVILAVPNGRFRLESK